MTVYHTTTTPSDTFNPYLPAIGRVLQVLQSYGPAGTTIEVCNRDLARAAECSAGRIPALLRTLEAEDRIERATGPRGSLIVVVDRSSMVDRVSSDQDADRAIATVTPDRSEASGCERSTMVDPPTPPIRYKHDQQQQHGAPPRKNNWAAVTIAGADFIPSAALERAGITPQILQAADAKIQTRREYDRAQQVRVLFRSLLTNQPIYSAAEIAARAQEQCYDHPRPATPSRARRQSGAHRTARTAGLGEPPPERIAEEQRRLAEALARFGDV